jgi:hypothetical protein
MPHDPAFENEETRDPEIGVLRTGGLISEIGFKNDVS